MKRIIIALTVIAFLFTSAASADLWVIDVRGIPSMDLEDDPDNITVSTTNIAPGMIITGLGWDLTIGTIGTSWRSEAVSRWSTDAGPFVFVSPGAGDNSPGTNAYSSGGIIDLLAAIGSYTTNINGNTSVEFDESYDDYVDSADAYYLAGTYTLQYTIPEPTFILGAGLLAALFIRRK
jgi:hypothetical protein